MVNVSCLNGSDCRRAAQYLITIVAVLVVGYLLSILPVMARLRFAGGLMADDLILFVARSAALVFFYLFARHAMAAIPDRGGALSFIRGIIEPLTILVIIVVGQGLVWKVIDPFVFKTGTTVYFSVAIALIIGAGVWLIYSAYLQAPYLVDAIQNLCTQFPKLTLGRSKLCPLCNQRQPENAQFCSQCGHEFSGPVKCGHCGEKLVPGQKYCQHCGSSVDGTDNSDSKL
ncbi:MAG: zinc ribbon domain-containing protein [Gammaproteobacteria bacterium]